MLMVVKLARDLYKTKTELKQLRKEFNRLREMYVVRDGLMPFQIAILKGGE